MTAPDVARGGLVIVDKPGGMTSHDVVSRMRRLAGTRKVGHAGTLDPMATGVLIIGIGQATRLLGHLALTDKSYDATIKLGSSTSTDDAEGDVISTAPADAVDAISSQALHASVQHLTGEILQVPPGVSAIKVDGVRSYARARSGETVELAPRPVTVSRFEIHRHEDDASLIDAVIDCSTGTYIRALARDLGDALDVGGHLSALRRTRVGSFDLATATPLEEIDVARDLLPLDRAVVQSFPTVEVGEDEARRVAHGQRRALALPEAAVVAILGPDARAIALVEPRDGVAHPLCVFG